MRKMLMIAAALMLAAPSANAAEKKFSSFAQCVHVRVGEANESICLGYAAGIAEALMTFAPGQACIPTVSTLTLFSIVKDYSDAHPEVLDLPAAEIFQHAFTGTWPCR
jgi:Rap1a immunity proteins